MNDIHFTTFDLNLLVVFEALYAERNVTRAARRLARTQSAVSHSLRRLREELSDPLFRATRRGLLPTPRAEVVWPKMKEALALVRGALAPPRPFVAKELRRTFVLVTGDYVELVLLPSLVARVRKEAPGVTLVVRPGSNASARELSTGEHDVAIAPGFAGASELRSQLLFDERFVCVMRAGHPASKKRLTAQRFAALEHALISPHGSGEGAVDVALRERGLSRDVVVRLPHFLVAPLVIAKSELVIAMPERLIASVAEPRKFAVRPMPLDVKGFDVKLFWHPRSDADDGHRWLREVIAEVAKGTAKQR